MQITRESTIQSIPTYAARESGRLTAEQVAEFAEAGVLILEDFVPAEDCRRLQQRVRELVDEFDPQSVSTIFSTTRQTQLNDEYFYESGDKIRFFFEDGAFDETGTLRQSKHDSLNKMGHAMHDLDPVFEAFSRTPKLAETVASLGFRYPGVIQSMYIFKPPGIGGEVTCHQDSTFIYTEPESCIGFWFAIDDATGKNGCMKFVPGGHKMPLKQRNRRLADGRFVIEDIDSTPWPDRGWVPAEARVGALVIFHGRMPHLSSPNSSDRSRHAYTLHVIDQQCEYPADNWLQRSDELPLRGFDQGK